MVRELEEKEDRKQGGQMKLSKNVIKAKAIEDMYSWILKFKNDGSIYKHEKEDQETYWEYIKKIQITE